MKNTGFSHLKTKLFPKKKPSINVGLGGPWNAQDSALTEAALIELPEMQMNLTAWTPTTHENRRF